MGDTISLYPHAFSETTKLTRCLNRRSFKFACVALAKHRFGRGKLSSTLLGCLVRVICNFKNINFFIFKLYIMIV